MASARPFVDRFPGSRRGVLSRRRFVQLGGAGLFGLTWPRLLWSRLSDRGLLDRTLGEFGRTPGFETNGKGRGHWPACYSGLLAGGGIRGGSVYGASDRHGAYVAHGRPVSRADFGATLFHALGVPPQTRYGANGFSLRVSEGEPLLELFG